MGEKKRQPVYILLTLSEQIALVNALENFAFIQGGQSRRGSATNLAAPGLGSLADLMVLLLQIGSVHRKPLLGTQNRVSGLLGQEALMASQLLIPVAECLRRVDRVVDQLDAQVSKYQRAFDQIYAQLEKITNTMGSIVSVLERIEQERSEETLRLARERQQGVVRCECGRTVSVEKEDEDGQEEKKDEENADEDG